MAGKHLTFVVFSFGVKLDFSKWCKAVKFSLLVTCRAECVFFFSHGLNLYVSFPVFTNLSSASLQFIQLHFKAKYGISRCF